MHISSRGSFALALATVFVGAVFLAAPEARAAKPISWYGSVLCADTVTYDCVTVEAETVEEEVKTKNGVKKVEKTLVRDWEERWPDEAERDMIKKINRMNYRLREGYKIAVPKDMKNKTLLDFAPFEKKIRAPGRKVIIVDLSKLAFAAYDHKGNLVRWGPAVGGKSYCSDVRRRCRSPIGTFSIYKKYGANYRSGKYPIGCRGSRCARMPYAMFFRGGYALHAGNLPGRHQSHGCVRLFYDDAKWLNREWAPNGTRVIVRSYGDSL